MSSNIKDVGEATRALEATLVRQLISASGAFKGGDVAGGQVRADMFVEALANAVAQGGGLGLAKLLETSMGGGAGEEPGATDPGFKAGALTPALSRFAGEGGPEAEGGPGIGRGAREGMGHGHSHEGGVSSGFGLRKHPIHGDERFHTGVDLRGREGTEIRAAAEGVVKSAGRRGGYGNAVEIDHGGGVTTLYAHASSLAVEPGQKVEPGQALGAVGQTGQATGPHLHFEVRVEGKPVDPRAALKAYGIRAEDTIGGKPPERF